MQRARFGLLLILTLTLLAGCGSSSNTATSAAAGTQPATATVVAAASPAATSAPTATPSATATASPVATTAAVPSPATTPAEAKVEIINFAFQPASLTITAGTTVVWTNTSPTQHTVADKAGGSWSSDILNQGQTFSHTFTTPGTYDYWCTVHPDMLGTIIVK